MSYVLAIDVGTSFTAAAVARFDQGTSSSPECLPLGLRGTSVPSVLFYPEEGPVLVGEAAERRGLDSPARVVREFKRRVGDAVPISVGTLFLPAEDVFATMARWVVDRAAEREGAPPSEIILTHPAAWGSHRTSLLREALAARSLHNVALVTEPEAAALHYASQVRVEEGSTIAVYDLGGGTFDTAVLRKAGSNRFDLLGRPEGIENLGGADFDAAVLRYVAGNTGGVLSSLDTSDPGVRGAVARLQRECVEAKEALSADSEASISVLLPGFQQQVRLVRSEFEGLVDQPIRDTVDALEQSLADLKLEPADLSAVLLIGGSSRIPLVAQVISEQLGRPIAVDADPKSSICLGAAAAAVLAREAAAEVAAQAAAAAAAGPAAAAPADAAPGHAPGRLASWSRKNPTAAGTMAGIAAQGAGPGKHGHRGGAHAPKPTVRLTAIAAAAAAFTVLSATAAQSPEGIASLTSILTPKADAAPVKGPSSGGPGGNGAGGPAAAGAGAEAQVPVKGIEASASKKDAAPGSAGLEVAASPTSRPAPSAAGEMAAADSGGTAALDAGTGTGTGGGTDPLGTSTGAPGTAGPVPGTSEPLPAETGTASPLPVDSPTTEEPPPATEEPPPATEEPPPPATEEPPPATEEPPPPATEEPPPATEEPPPPATEEPPPPAPEPTSFTATESAPATDPATATEPAA